jgi:hypothetical protein
MVGRAVGSPEAILILISVRWFISVPSSCFSYLSEVLNEAAVSPRRNWLFERESVVYFFLVPGVNVEDRLRFGTIRYSRPLLHCIKPLRCVIRTFVCHRTRFFPYVSHLWDAAFQITKNPDSFESPLVHLVLSPLVP